MKKIIKIDKFWGALWFFDF